MPAHTYATTWSGAFPNLCSGQWELYRDDVLLDIDIPFNGEDDWRGEPANTFGSYPTWHFGGESGWDEVWDFYDDGLNVDAWCNEYCDWLETFAPESDWPAIFEAFQENDWRHNSCGGCI